MQYDSIDFDTPKRHNNLPRGNYKSQLTKDHEYEEVFGRESDMEQLLLNDSFNIIANTKNSTQLIVDSSDG